MSLDRLNFSFTDGQTTIRAEHLNAFVDRINSLIDAVGGVTPTQTVATPTISISGTTATISCSTSGATIYYTLNGNTPTTSSTQYSSPITLSGACTIKAIAVKSGMTTSQVAQQTYVPSSSYDSDAQAIMNRYTKSLSDTKKSAFNTFIVTLKTAGVYDKIDYLLLPFLANNTTEAVQNAKDGTAFLNNSTSLSLSNNGIKPIVGSPVCVTSGLTNKNDQDMHISFFNNDAPTLASGKWDVVIACTTTPSASSGISSFGKYIAGGVGVQYYGTVNGTDQRWHPSELESASTTAKTHCIITGNSSRLLLSVNGTQVTRDTEVFNGTSGTSTYKFGQVKAGDTYISAAESSSSLGGATQFNYGLISMGKALTDSQCTAFNNAVTALMTTILA